MSRTITPLKRARFELGLLQADVAARAHIHQTRLSQLENGRLQPRTEELERIAGALGVPIDTLLHPVAEGRGEVAA